jgi:hypothetical protein
MISSVANSGTCTNPTPSIVTLRHGRLALDKSFVFFLPKFLFVFSSFFTQIFTKFRRKSREIHRNFEFRMVSNTNTKLENFDKICLNFRGA